MRYFRFLLYLFLSISTVAAKPSDFETLQEVPKHNQIQLNIIPRSILRKNCNPIATPDDCVNIGLISARSFTLFGRIYNIKLIQFSTEPKLEITQILGESTLKETWLLTLTNLKDSIHKNVFYLTIEALSTKSDLNFPSITYSILPNLSESHEIDSNQIHNQDLIKSKLLIGLWKGTRHSTIYKSDGSFVVDPDLPGFSGNWKIENNILISKTEFGQTFDEIISLNEHQLTIRDDTGGLYKLNRIK